MTSSGSVPPSCPCRRARPLAASGQCASYMPDWPRYSPTIWAKRRSSSIISKEVLMASAKGVLRVGGWGHHACYLSCPLVLGVKHR